MEKLDPNKYYLQSEGVERYFEVNHDLLMLRSPTYKNYYESGLRRVGSNVFNLTSYSEQAVSDYIKYINGAAEAIDTDLIQLAEYMQDSYTMREVAIRLLLDPAGLEYINQQYPSRYRNVKAEEAYRKWLRSQDAGSSSSSMNVVAGAEPVKPSPPERQLTSLFGSMVNNLFRITDFEAKSLILAPFGSRSKYVRVSSEQYMIQCPRKLLPFYLPIKAGFDEIVRVTFNAKDNTLQYAVVVEMEDGVKRNVWQNTMQPTRREQQRMEPGVRYIADDGRKWIVESNDEYYGEARRRGGIVRPATALWHLEGNREDVFRQSGGTNMFQKDGWSYVLSAKGNMLRVPLAYDAFIVDEGNQVAYAHRWNVTNQNTEIIWIDSDGQTRSLIIPTYMPGPTEMSSSGKLAIINGFAIWISVTPARDRVKLYLIPLKDPFDNPAGATNVFYVEYGVPEKPTSVQIEEMLSGSSDVPSGETWGQGQSDRRRHASVADSDRDPFSGKAVEVPKFVEGDNTLIVYMSQNTVVFHLNHIHEYEKFMNEGSGNEDGSLPIPIRVFDYLFSPSYWRKFHVTSAYISMDSMIRKENQPNFESSVDYSSDEDYLPAGQPRTRDNAKEDFFYRFESEFVGPNRVIFTALVFAKHHVIEPSSPQMPTRHPTLPLQLTARPAYVQQPLPPLNFTAIQPAMFPLGPDEQVPPGGTPAYSPFNGRVIGYYPPLDMPPPTQQMGIFGVQHRLEPGQQLPPGAIPIRNPFDNQIASYYPGPPSAMNTMPGVAATSTNPENPEGVSRRRMLEAAGMTFPQQLTQQPVQQPRMDSAQTIRDRVFGSIPPVQPGTMAGLPLGSVPIQQPAPSVYQQRLMEQEFAEQMHQRIMGALIPQTQQVPIPLRPGDDIPFGAEPSFDAAGQPGWLLPPGTIPVRDDDGWIVAYRPGTMDDGGEQDIQRPPTGLQQRDYLPR